MSIKYQHTVARFFTALFLLCAVGSAVAQSFALPRLLLGANGPTNRIFTAGDVVTPVAQLDSNVWYKVIVRDGFGNVLNPTFPCMAGTAFASTNSYVVQPNDPPSTNAPYTFVIEEFANGACSGAAIASKTQQFYVVTARAYTNSALTALTNRFTRTQTAYLRLDGLPPSSSDWSVTWFLPSGSSSCANTSNSDRPDSISAGRLPSTYLAYPPSDSFSDNWNKAANYDSGNGCDNFSSANEGQWQLKVQLNPTNFVTLRAFVMSNDCFTPTVDITERTVCAGGSTTFTAATNGTGPLAFVWRKDGVAIPVTSRSFTISPVNVSTAGVYTIEVTGPCGKATNSATLTVNSLLATQPLPDQSVCAGEAVTFLAVTNGSGPFTFQWRKGTTNLVGETGASFTVASPVTTNSGNYNVIISGPCNSVTNSGKLTVYSNLTLSPMTNAVRYVGTVASFSTTPSGGNGTNSYAWLKDGIIIPNETNRTLILTNVTVADGGNYTVVAHGGCSAAQSAILLVAHCFESLDVMLVIDRSGSMVGQPYTDARTAATNLIRNLVLSTNSDMVGLASYNPTSTLDHVFTTNAVLLEQAIHALPPATNGTCISCGIATAQMELNSIRHRSGALPVMLILSDGVPHDFDTPSNALYNATAAKNAGTRVFTIGLNDGSGTNVDIGLLSTMSSSSNDFFYATSSSQLTAIFDEISALLCRGPNDIVGPSPTNTTVCAGANVEFTVSASGCALFTFQWSKQGTLLPGQTNSTLYLPNVTSADAGVYDVIISSFCGTITNSATLTVNSSPQIIFGPMSQTRCAGASASFNVSAAGSGLSYQWWHDATPLPGQTNTTLALTNLAAADAGFYYAVVSSPCGTPVATAAQLTVNTPPALTPLGDVAACPNQLVTFQTTPTGTGPFTYVWRKNGAVISGATTNRLALAPANALSVATYSVEVTGVCGSATNSASLILLTNTTTTPLVSLTRCVGTVASFATVPAGTGPFTFVWRKDGVIIPGAVNPFIILSSVALTEAGTYSVEVRGACQAVTNSATLTVNALTTASAVTNVAACGGDAVSFSTIPQGAGPFSFAWRKDGVLMNGATNSTLLISNVSPANAGIYSVEVAGLCNAVTNTATLTLLQNTTASALSNATRCVGEPVSFTTTSSGTGPFNFVWRKNGVVLTNITNATLSFTSVTTNDGGVYSVEVMGACNAVTNSASLFVNELTTASSLANTMVCAGELVSFATVPQGTGPFTFIWRKDGVILNGATNASLTIFNAAVGDSATYAVEVTGMCNAVTNSATLMVRALTTAVALPDSTYCAGEAVNFAATPSGAGPFTFIWRKDGVMLPGETNATLSRSSVTTNDAGIYSVEVSGACNSVTNSSALVVNELATATPFANETVCAGDVVSFATVVHGTGPFAFTWRKAGQVIEGATNASLAISNAAIADSAIYAVEVTGQCNSVTNSALLTVRELTTATPMEGATRCVGESVSFSTVASGTGPFAFVWRKDGIVIVDETNSSLSLPAVTTNQAGVYAVEIVGACNAVTNAAALVVKETVTATPLSDTARCMGDVATFITAPSGTGPFVFVWRKGGALLANETNASLLFAISSTNDAGTFTVEVSGACGSVTNSALLRVLDQTSVASIADQTHCAGATVTFTTSAFGSGPFSYIWRKDGSALAGQTNSSIMLPNVSVADAARYSVEVAGSCSSATNSATLTVNTPAVIAALTDLSICGVQDVLFAPVISGNGTYTFLWRKDGTVLAGETNATLLISAADGTNAGLYALEVHGSCGITTNSAVLSISTNTVVATLSSQTHCAGDTAVFAAEVFGEGPFAFTWKKDGAVISNATTSVLTLTNVSATDNGLYTVEVMGGCDTATANATLAVNATVTATPLRSLNACIGGNAVFSTTAGGGAGPFRFIWRKDGVALTGQSNSTLILANVTSTNAGLYSVEVIGCGRVTNFASLSVLSPVAATLPTNIVACVCDDLVLAPTVTGVGPFACVWRKNGAVLVGETNSSLLLPMLNTLSAGNYTLELHGPCNSVTNTTSLQVINATSGRWSNTNLLVIPQLGVASTYPSKILVQCAPKSISHLAVTLHGLTHSFPDDVDIMLVAPNGTAIKLLSDCGGSGANAISNVDLTFSAEAMAFLSDNAKIRAGIYRPSDYPNDIDPFQSPAPTNATTTNLFAFYGTNPNGYWSLFVVDDHGQDAGSLKGWTLDFGEAEFVLPNVWLSSPEMLPNGAFQMQLHGTENKTYYVEASANFTNWTIIQTNYLPTGSATVIDYTAPLFDYRFYRATGCRDR
jgi:subtilisin-like proprotein convertase family protein